MPPHTPSRMRGTAKAAGGGVLAAVAVGDLPVRDFLERDGQVVLGRGVDHRGRELLERALAEVVVVAVDLTRPLGGDDHARVRRVDVLQQAVNAGRDHAEESRAPRTMRSSWSAASGRRSLTTTN